MFQTLVRDSLKRLTGLRGSFFMHLSSLSRFVPASASPLLLAAVLLASVMPSQAAVHRRHRHTVAHMRRVARHMQTGRTTAHATIPDVPLRHVASLPPLKGTYESLVRQNERNQAEGLQRIENDEQLDQLREEKLLVSLPVTDGLHVNPEMPQNRRYCRPWTARFLADLGRVHYERFHRSLQVNSAVRTVQYQRRLMAINGNAAPADGDVASPHLTGATIDIGKHGLTMSEIAWMRAYLLPLQSAGKIDVEEEFHQACFHITVYDSYAPMPLMSRPPVEVASAPQAPAARPRVVRASIHRVHRSSRHRRVHASLLAAARLR